MNSPLPPDDSQESHDSDVLLPAIARLINRLLKQQPDIAADLHALDGRIVLLSISGTDIRIFVEIEAAGINLASACAKPSDVTLTGSISDFIALARNQREGSSVSAGQIDIQGDLGTAQQFQKVISESHIDFEELLARVTGDVFAYRAGRAAKGGIGWAKQAMSSLERDLGEYALYEKRLVPSREELERFSAEVDDLALLVERLEFKISRLGPQGR